MRKMMAVLLSGVLCLTALSGCDEKEYQDGTYTAEFASYDSRGYRDYIEVTVEAGTVTSLVYDALNEEGGRKTEDDTYRQQMEAVQNNYPAQVSSTLVNQYIAGQDLGKVDVVAGATYSTQCFKALFEALEQQMYEGNTTPLVVENIPEL